MCERILEKERLETAVENYMEKIGQNAIAKKKRNSKGTTKTNEDTYYKCVHREAGVCVLVCMRATPAEKIH